MAEYITPEQQVKDPKALMPESDQVHQSTAKMVNELLSRSHRATKQMRSEWPGNYRFVIQGEQWPIKRPKWRFSEVVNMTWSNIMTEVAIQTDTRPKVDFEAVEATDFTFVEVLKDINNVNWGKSEITGHGWNRKMQTAIFKSKLYHVVHAEVCWDPELENGIGDISFKVLDPYGCFWDPLANSIGEARYFIYAEVTPTAKLRQENPELADRIKPDVTLLSESSRDGIDDHDVDLFFSRGNVQNQSHTDRNKRGYDRYGGEEMSMKLRCWIKDETVCEDKEKQEDGTEVYVLRKMYPKGRYIEVVGDVVLQDRENEYEDGLFPIATLVNYDYGEYAGENEVTHQKGPQKLVNYTLSHIMDQFKMGANPQKIVTNRAHDIVKKLTNEPGLVIEVPDQGDIRFEPGTGIASGSFNLINVLKSYMDAISGLMDVSRGAPQPGVTSGLMLEGFVEAAQTRPRLKNRSVDEFLTQVGYLMASRYLQYYTAPRSFRITNKEGFPEIVDFFIKGTDQGRQAEISRTSIGADGVAGPMRSMSVEVKGMPDVRVTSGSNLPYARAQKTATALDLHSRGAITLESMLEAINWPNAKEESQRVKEEAMKAQQAMQMEQPVEA